MIFIYRKHITDVTQGGKETPLAVVLATEYIHLSVTQGGKEMPLAVVLATGGRGDKSRKLIMAHQKG